MEIKTLEKVSFKAIVECFLAAFSDYFVAMPQETSYYEKRWKAAGVDWKYSYGAFDQDKLVAFIIHAVDYRQGKKKAYNTGTGVLPSHRGNKLIKRIYQKAMIDLAKADFNQIELEVIKENIPALRSYQSIGFEISSSYKCYSGEISLGDISEQAFELREIDKGEFDWELSQGKYSWDYQKPSLVSADYKYYYLVVHGKPESYFIINATGNIGQFDVLQENDNAWKRLMKAIASVSNTVKIINVDESNASKVQILERHNLRNTVDQYEMLLRI
ncbi:GNAT family N-acetyltransferase [Aureibacter tunicatorum]|uniref:Ribosomal protein S18 acetylase RimI-like enzyme n=1 Tax=Aureibacter tunicatorum TaxID=866807 RepID=A0AAE3XSE4_9BACT|nr:GNAT family N-acetyltransferase [Aureibacter tunicatorum]MDR6240664.1 ribosomal protein S18 acetylase RimI-like enzyme [Aureibacter tunicatorum]BDD07003.1 hypothetical protein AUTU_44860 [Aureibacter tunicatorum]